MGVLLIVIATAVVGPAPADAGSGTGSVTLSQSTDLVDGQAVTVDGTGWEADEAVVINQCTVGTDKCGFAMAAAEIDAAGAFAAPVRVRTVLPLEAGGSVDCRVAACEVRATTQLGLEASSAAPTSFDPGPPLLPPPTIVVDPTSGIVDGRRVTVTGSQFFYVQEVLFAQCRGGTTDPGRGGCSGIEGSADPDVDGNFTVELEVRAVIGRAADRTDCRIDACAISAAMFPYRTVAAEDLLGFDPDAPLRPAPELTVTPTTGLVDGQQVAVSGSGFVNGEAVALVQCAASIGDLYEGCNLPDGDLTSAGADGLVAAPVVVRERFDPQRGADVDCAAEACVVRAWRLEVQTWVEVPITFALEGPPPATPVAVIPSFTG